MLSLDELKQKVDAVQLGNLSLDDFEDWFRTNSKGAYASKDPHLSEAAASVEAAFSKYSFQVLDQQQLREDLLQAVHPSVQSSFAENRYGSPNYMTPGSSVPLYINAAA
ncbi:MAG TPA: hypothetical protein VK776_00280 [Bryobacteraceae bacterium]|jgi:hypothetical protein|nr:hypothetical protein [Bryobacteraceae bacterium]